MREPGLLAIIYILLVNAVVYGQAKPLWEPPKIGIQSIVEQPSGTRDLVSKIMIGSFQLVLEETSLKEVGTHFSAPIGHSGDAGNSLDWVCLHGRDQSGQWILWIESAEIHGPRTGGFLLMRRTANNQLDSRCRAIGDGPISLQIPLRLGMSRDQALAVLGTPTSKSKEHLFYYHHRVVMLSRKTGTVSEPFDLINTLYIRFNSSNAIDAFQVWRTTSS